MRPTSFLSVILIRLAVICVLLSGIEIRAFPSDKTPIDPPGSEFGPELKARPLNIGPSMDVAVAGDFVYAIGRGRLTVLQGARAGSPNPVGRLEGLGNTRQIAVQDGRAYVTAREDGLFIIDVSDPAQPRLVGRYDTAELATAVGVSGQIVAVGNRFAGLELIDVTRPEAPRHLATIRLGEVQSVVFDRNLIYAGLWADKAVVIVDVSDPLNPRRITTVPLDGHGDGLDVKGTLLAAATGHHPRADRVPKPGEASYGRGHGVEFFDISNPAEPKRLSGLKFPPFYRTSMDTWGVTLAGRHAFVYDTFNGFFLVDLARPEQPVLIGHKQLPKLSSSGDPGPVTGVAVARGRAFLAGASSDLQLLETGIEEAEPVNRTARLKAPGPVAAKAAPEFPSYVVDGSIRAVTPWRDDLLLVAAGSAGFHVVRAVKDGFEAVAAYPTRGYARDVVALNDMVYVAESLGGLSLWRRKPDGGLERTGAYEVPGKSIHQIVLADGGRMAFLAVGANALHVVKLKADGSTPECVHSESPMTGLFYREPFSPLSQDGKRILVQWHTTGLHEFIAENGQVKRTGARFTHSMGSGCGATVWGGKWLGTSRSGVFFLGAAGEWDSVRDQQVGVEGRGFPGKPSAYGNIVFIADPFLGEVVALDFKDESKPRLLSEVHLSGHPGRVKMYGTKALIPAGRQGLLLWDFGQP